MEVQMTDFENAAFAVFMVLLSRAILKFNLNLYLPISKVHLAFYRLFKPILTSKQVDENMATTQRRGAARHEMFHFRKSVYPLRHSGSEGSTASSPGSHSVNGGSVKKESKLGNGFPPLPIPHDGVKFPCPIEEEYEEMSMNEIINGKVLVGFL